MRSGSRASTLSRRRPRGAPDDGARGARDDGARSARDDGFSIIEMMVAMVLLLLLLLIAADLFLESARLIQHSARRARDARPEFASQVLHSDLRSAASASASVGIWSSGPLGLTRPDGSTVVWSRDAGNLLTRSQGDPSSARPYLDRVTLWRWRRLGPRLLEVEVAMTLAGGEDYLHQAANPRLQRARATTSRMRMIVALRGGGGSGW